jgi:hypothetical protein
VNISFRLFLIAVCVILSACAPALLEVTRGPSLYARNDVVTVRSFLIGGFDGPLGAQLRQRVITALEARRFIVLDAQAVPRDNGSDFAVTGVVNAERASVTTSNVYGPPGLGLGISTTNEYWNVSGVIVRVSSRRDGQTARVLELRPNQRLNATETAALIADGIAREFSPAR